MIIFITLTRKKNSNSNVLLSNIFDHFPLYVKLKYCNQNKTNMNSKIQFYHDFSKINTQRLMIDTSTDVNKFYIYKIIQRLNTLKVWMLIDKIKDISDKINLWKNNENPNKT